GCSRESDMRMVLVLLTSLRSFSSFWHGIARKRSLLVLRASVAIKSTEKAATMSRVFCTFFPQKVPIAVCDWCCLPLFGRLLTAVFARGVLCTFWPQKVPKTPRQMPAPTSSRLTLAPGDYSRGRTCPVPFARAFSRAFVSRLRHRAGIVRGNSVFSAGKRSEHANMRTGANISCSLVRGESRHRPWKRF
uniref:hypothetical protein n=2 Tax=Alistipes shahii TaxID=328814 RepID=UPI0034A21F77